MKTFQHGVHPAEHKDATADSPTRRLPFVSHYVLPLAQHGGRPSKAIVTAGVRVERGDPVAEPDGFVSTTLCAPVAGTVTAVERRRHPSGALVDAIEIAADPWSPQRLPSRDPLDWAAMPLEEFVAQVQRAGIVGLGGAAFPSHVKYKVPEGRRLERLAVNGCECEPYLTCDHRLMVERPEAVVRGAMILGAKLGVREIVVGVEANKPDGIAALERAAKEAAGSTDGPTVDVVPLDVKYPQGAEKMLIRALWREEVPAGKLPLDLGVLVNNVQTMAALADWFDRGVPLIERWLTVSGPGVREPANLVVPIGTSVRDILHHCGGLLPEAREVVLGGPMMGQPLATLDVPVLKGTSGILAFTEARAARPTEYACLKCGRCLEACSNFLNPSRLARLARAGRFDDMDRAFAMDCMECGACSWSCPSNIPIVQLIRVAKSEIRKHGKGTK
ncbi:MAG: electron transport complex subunit RsxC [Gemmatimonadetes bacterium]|nr:electron transport complex subunit RsxC [Gemmatimonadota bacterium]